MKLRLLVVCNKNGQKTNPILQYWDTESITWIDVPVFECKDYELYLYNSDKDAA